MQNNHLLKYLEMTRKFMDKAVEIEISIKQNQRSIEKLIPKAKKDTELADLIITTTTVNEKAMDFIMYTKELLQQVANDEHVLNGARYRNQLDDQSEIIKAFYEK